MPKSSTQIDLEKYHLIEAKSFALHALIKATW
jgi:hypothetical protein